MLGGGPPLAPQQNFFLVKGLSKGSGQNRWLSGRARWVELFDAFPALVPQLQTVKSDLPLSDEGEGLGSGCSGSGCSGRLLRPGQHVRRSTADTGQYGRFVVPLRKWAVPNGGSDGKTPGMPSVELCERRQQLASSGKALCEIPEEAGRADGVCSAVGGLSHQSLRPGRPRPPSVRNSNGIGSVVDPVERCLA